MVKFPTFLFLLFIVVLSTGGLIVFSGSIILTLVFSRISEEFASIIYAFSCLLQDTVAIIQLLVAIAVYFRAPVRFPEYVNAQILVIQKKDNQLKSRYITEQLTTTQPELGVKVDLRI